MGKPEQGGPQRYCKGTKENRVLLVAHGAAKDMADGSLNIKPSHVTYSNLDGDQLWHSDVDSNGGSCYKF